MPALDIHVYADFDAFADDWMELGYDTVDTEQYWALLGALESGEVVLHLPEWLAAEKTGYVDGTTPTAFVGRIDQETEKAIRVTNAADARPLSRLAARLHSLQQSISRLDEQDDTDPERLAWLRNRHVEKQAAFDDRSEVPTLAEPWLPKSQLEFVGRRAPGR